jgi:uncharacterized protein (DUF2147 family)
MKGLPILLALLAAACAGGEPRAPAAEVSAQPAPSATVYFLRKYGGAGVDATLTTKDRGVDRRLYTGSYFASSSFNQYIDAAFEVAAGKTYYVELDVGALDLALRMLEEAEGVSLLKSLKFTPTPR